MKIRMKLLIVYIIGGALPLLIFGFVLMNNARELLIRQTKENDAGSAVAAELQVSELFNTVNMASRYFIFDPQLEKIASYDYVDYGDMVKDFSEYQRFKEHGILYADLVSSFSVYMNNPTLKSNANFVYADETIREADWYRRAADKSTSVSHWMIIPRRPMGEEELGFTRRISTREGDPVGILVMHIRENRIREAMANMSGTAFLLSDYDELLLEGGSGSKDRVSYEDFYRAVADEGGTAAFSSMQERHRGTYQGDLQIKGRDYLVTGMRLNLKQAAYEERLDIISIHSYEEILADTYAQSRNHYLVFGISAIVSLLLIVVFSSGFSNRIRRFKREIERTAAGEYSFKQPLKGKDEISELYNHLGRIIHQINAMNAEIQEEKLKSEKLRTAQREAELKMLTMQINPHFLYNTLETIRMKARIQEEYEIEEIVKRLAKLLRYTLSIGDRDVPLAKETEVLEDYLKIQRFRLGGRLKTSIELPEELEDCRIMPLLIQPLVENAMIHALESKTGRAELRVSASRISAAKEKGAEAARSEEEEYARQSGAEGAGGTAGSEGAEGTADILEIAVSDNGEGIPPERLEELALQINEPDDDGSHIGLRNVHQRIRLRYGSAYGLSIESKLGEGTTMILRLPLIHGDSESGAKA